MIQGGRIFAESSLVPYSKQALQILDVLFESDPSVLSLLVKSLDKVLTFACEGTIQDTPH